MPTYPIREARAKLAELISAAVSGEDVIVTRDGRPVVRIQPFHQSRPPTAGLSGVLKGKMVFHSTKAEDDAPNAGSGHSMQASDR